MKNLIEQAKYFTMIDNLDESLLRIANRLEIVECGGIRETINCGACKVIRCKHYGKFCIVDNDGNVIVPLGRYSFIDGFDHGYARVKIELQNQHELWEIIDETGNEVVEPLYDNIWNFFGKDRETTILKKDDEQFWFDLLDGDICDFDPWDYHHSQSIDNDQEENDSEEYSSESCFSINNCYDSEGNFDYEQLEDAIFDGEYVPEDW